MTYEVEDVNELTSSQPIVLKVSLERNEDEDEENREHAVVAPLYPFPKTESWWTVISEPATKTLLSVKRVTLGQRHTVNLDFSLPAGTHDLALVLVSDSYAGADQEEKIILQVQEGEEESEEDEEDEEMEDS